MTEKPISFDPEERIFTLSDVQRLFRKQKKRLVKMAWIGGFCAFSFAAIKAPKYRIEATFKEGVEKSGADSALKDLLGGLSTAQQPQAVALMKSYQVLKPLVEKMGLQAQAAKPGFIAFKALRRVKENILAELQIPLDDIDWFEFHGVSYEGENKLGLTLLFSDPEHFTVLVPGLKETAGTVGVPVSLPGVSFTVSHTPSNLKLNKGYSVTIDSWVEAAKRLRGQLQIVGHKTNKSIYDLAFFHRNRQFGVELLNGLMEQYRIYLKEDHDHLAKEQIAYLEERQEQLYGKMSSMFDEHAAYLSRNLEEKGVLALKQESESLLTPHQQMLSKIFQIDVEMGRLDQIEKEPRPLAFDDGSFSHGLVQISQTLQDLKQQRDLLELSLHQHQSFVDDRLAARRQELREVRSRREAVQGLLESVDRETEVPLASFDASRALAVWAQKIHETQAAEEREDLAEYLENFARLLSVREKMLQERFLYGSDAPKELEGIDLATARKLFVDYNGKLDQAEAAMRHFTQLKGQLAMDGCELSSLSSVLSDPLSQNLIESASSIALKLKDEKYHSGKEGERWIAELQLQKKILGEHLDQLCKVEELNSALVREKIVGLQQVSLDCINRQISVLNEQIQDAVKERRQSLIEEKKLLEKKMQELRLQASDLPEKWRKEKWLDLKSDLGEKIMQTITEVVESKTIGHQLHHVESKPLDFAVLPLLPHKPGLFSFALLGAFGAAFGAFFLSLMRTVLKGFPSSAEKLRAMRFPLLGEISANCDGPAVDPVTGGDLELLRQIVLFLESPARGNVVGLISGQGPDYSYALCENLARISYKSILVRCDFGAKFNAADLPGLLQIWKGETAELPIRKGKGYDWITAGGFTPYGSEVIQSKPFEKLLEILKKNYDWVFILSRAPLASAEPLAALRVCGRAVVTVAGEPTELLTPFADWAYHDGCQRLTFIASP